ncbi:MAG: phage head spike fiber domain-containing protein [Bryobacteraceae bacterium]
MPSSMRVFPQNSAGAIGHYPIRKRRLSRTVVNECPGGKYYKLSDDAAATVEWQLRFAGLTDTETATLNSLFQSVEGRLDEFVFLDPTDNLFRYSEKLDEPVWERNTLLTVSGGIADTAGTERASRLTNTSAAPLRIEQELSAPGWFQYAFSLSARSSQSTQMTLFRSAGSEVHQAQHAVGAEWKRLLLSGKLNTTLETVRFGLEIAPGAALDVYGLQVEAQVGASAYRKTLSRSGVYPKARFGSDILELTAEGPNRHSCNLRIWSRA